MWSCLGAGPRCLRSSCQCAARMTGMWEWESRRSPPSSPDYSVWPSGSWTVYLFTGISWSSHYLLSGPGCHARVVSKSCVLGWFLEMYPGNIPSGRGRDGASYVASVATLRCSPLLECSAWRLLSVFTHTVWADLATVTSSITSTFITVSSLFTTVTHNRLTDKCPVCVCVYAQMAPAAPPVCKLSPEAHV